MLKSITIFFLLFSMSSQDWVASLQEEVDFIDNHGELIDSSTMFLGGAIIEKTIYKFENMEKISHHIKDNDLIDKYIINYKKDDNLFAQVTHGKSFALDKSCHSMRPTHMKSLTYFKTPQMGIKKYKQVFLDQKSDISKAQQELDTMPYHIETLSESAYIKIIESFKI